VTLNGDFETHPIGTARKLERLADWKIRACLTMAHADEQLRLYAERPEVARVREEIREAMRWERDGLT